MKNLREFLPSNHLFTVTTVFIITISIVLFFSFTALCQDPNIPAIIGSASPIFNSGSSIVHEISVTAKIYPLIEIDTNQESEHFIIKKYAEEEFIYTIITISNNEDAVLTFSGVENLIPSIDQDIPNVAVNSRIDAFYALTPLFTDYISPDELNNIPFVIPFSTTEEETRKYILRLKLKPIIWDPATNEGTYPYIWHEDPDGFIITVTLSP